MPRVAPQGVATKEAGRRPSRRTCDALSVSGLLVHHRDEPCGARRSMHMSTANLYQSSIYGPVAHPVGTLFSTGQWGNACGKTRIAPRRRHLPSVLFFFSTSAFNVWYWFFSLYILCNFCIQTMIQSKNNNNNNATTVTGDQWSRRSADLGGKDSPGEGYI